VTAQQAVPNTHETVIINGIFRLEFPLQIDDMHRAGLS